MPHSDRSIIIAGASGVVGRHLGRAATDNGWTVKTLTRGEEGAGRINWNPANPDLDSLAREMAGADVLVNLAGASLSEGRLGAAHRERVLQSRVRATHALAAAHALCPNPPGIWLQASAVGYYGDCGDEIVDENAGRGDMFLSEVCQTWESAVGDVSARVVVLRIGLVLAADAPAWQKMLSPIKWGVGGALGSGRQWYAWITADDLARACLFLVDRADAQGPYNLAAPEPIQQLAMTRQCAKALGRPSFMPVPAFALKAVLGEVAGELVLPSCRAVPSRLESLGFEWTHSTFEQALETLI